ncbi:hypothetical protein HYV31_01215 [candidate division WWE3 bacterium]|nr:hypothetical protein [candidate division WWE3 bacterium]
MNTLKKFKISFTKRHKYILVSFLSFVGLSIYAFGGRGFTWLGILICLLTALVVFPYIQYSNLTINSMRLRHFVSESYFMVILLPFTLELGGVFALYSFPSLSLTAKIGGLLIITTLMYLLSLVLNIILVVFEKEETIPLFRVASTWIQILAVIIAIPLFSGFFKLAYNGFVQSFLVGVLSVLFTILFLWVVDLDPEIPPINRGERIILSLIGGFVAFSLSLSVSFVSTEAFLRALLCSSSMMSLQSYLHLHYKNLVTKKLVIEYALITLTFLFIVLVFNS